jgi:hypothetical protein
MFTVCSYCEPQFSRRSALLLYLYATTVHAALVSFGSQYIIIYSILEEARRHATLFHPTSGDISRRLTVLPKIRGGIINPL